VKALSDAGHEIMNHSNTHPHMTKLSKEKMKEELTECNNKIEAVTGVKPTLFRAPYGDYNNEVIQTIRECGCYTIQWDVDSLDWKDLSAGEITKRVTERLAPGSIVLFHNAAKNTPEALPQILTKVREEGYTLVPISQLIYTENYKIDNSGRQINCEEN
ncbi:MAG: polysaccharide deacetylase family protein, partial [Clostridia bacterium]|nr:polysaccharide deacetylase family protein [Clostridia bacterium]